MIEYDAYIGLDVHKEPISVAIADAGRSGVVRLFGTIPNEPYAIYKLVKKLSSRHGRVEVVYEAGRVVTTSIGKLRRWGLFAG